MKRKKILIVGMNMILCPVCNERRKNIMSHIILHARNNPGENHHIFLSRLNAVIDSCTSWNLYIGEIVEAVRKKGKGFQIVTYGYVSSRVRETCPDRRHGDILSYRRTGEGNTSKLLKVRKKISESVKGKWEVGAYRSRINGMLGKVGQLHHNYREEKHTPLFLAENDYVEFLSKFQDTDYCMRCGVLREDSKINVHHVDENHGNFLVSNLEPLCIPCHASFHYESRKCPFIIVYKDFIFAAAHHLPGYEGDCRFTHGHEWKLSVGIKRRVDPDTGMAIDFKNLKNIVNEFVIDVLDHDDINRYLPNPTAENIVVWAWERLMFDGLLKGIYSISLWESRDSHLTIDVEGMLSVFKSNVEKYVGK